MASHTVGAVFLTVAGVVLQYGRAEPGTALGSCMLAMNRHTSVLNAELHDDLGTDSSEHSDKLSSMLQYVTQQGALAGNRSNYTMSAEVSTALATFLEYLQSMHKKMIELHSADQSDIDEAIAMATNCRTGNAPPNTVVTLRSDHATCRQEQADLYDIKDEHCTDYDAQLSSKSHNVPSCDLSTISDPSVRTQFNLCLIQFHQWTQSLIKHYEECRVATENLAIQTRWCDLNQTRFESATCQVHGGFCACESRTTKHYNLRVEQVAKLVSNRKIDRSAGAHIECMVDVLTANATAENITEKFHNCKTESTNVTHLDVNYGNLPGASAECNITIGPCAKEWLDLEYTGKEWQLKAPPTTCLPCEAPNVCECSGHTQTIIARIAEGPWGGADCNSVYLGAPFCYTLPGACDDGVTSPREVGQEWSHAACRAQALAAGPSHGVFS